MMGIVARNDDTLIGTLLGELVKMAGPFFAFLHAFLAWLADGDFHVAATRNFVAGRRRWICRERGFRRGR